MICWRLLTLEKTHDVAVFSHPLDFVDEFVHLHLLILWLYCEVGVGDPVAVDKGHYQVAEEVISELAFLN